MNPYILLCLLLCLSYANASNTLAQLKHRMHNTAQRHEVLSKNIANLNTPGWQSIDMVEKRHNMVNNNCFTLKRTSPKHLSISSATPGRTAEIQFEKKDIEKKPNKNNVSLQSQTMKINHNAKSYETALHAYKGCVDILKSSISSQ